MDTTTVRPANPDADPADYEPETLSAIAQRTGRSKKALFEANRGVIGSSIDAALSIGMPLDVPDKQAAGSGGDDGGS